MAMSSGEWSAPKDNVREIVGRLLPRMVFLPRPGVPDHAPFGEAPPVHAGRRALPRVGAAAGHELTRLQVPHAAAYRGDPAHALMAEDARVRDARCERAQAQHPVGAVAYAAHDHVDPSLVLTGHRFVDLGHRGFARPCHQEYLQPKSFLSLYAGLFSLAGPIALAGPFALAQ